MHFTRHSRSKHPDGSFRLGRVMVPPDLCCSACSVAVRRSFNPTKRRSSVCSAAVRLFLASLVQRQRIGPRSCRGEVWCSKRASLPPAARRAHLSADSSKCLAPFSLLPLVSNHRCFQAYRLTRRKNRAGPVAGKRTVVWLPFTTAGVVSSVQVPWPKSDRLWS